MQINLLNKTIPTEQNAADLFGWMNDVSVEIVDEVLEFLVDRELLTEQGERVAHKFWQIFIREDLVENNEKN